MNPLKVISAILSNSKFDGNSNNLIIINEGGLGDYIHSIPAIKYLKENNKKITIITNDSFKDILHDTKYANNKLKLTSPKLVMNSKTNIGFFDNTFDFNAERIKRKYITRNWREIHWAEFYLNTVKDLFKLNKKFIMKQRKSSPKYISIHPGSSNPEKNWSIEKFIWIGKQLSQNNKVMFLIGPQDKDLEPIIKKSGLKIIETSNFSELGNIASKTKLYIGNDSGPMHFFSLYTCKILGIFTYGCAYTHYPYSNNAWYYFEEKIFNDYYKNGKISKINLTKENCLKQVKLILGGKKELLSNFYKVKLND